MSAVLEGRIVTGADLRTPDTVTRNATPGVCKVCFGERRNAYGEAFQVWRRQNRAKWVGYCWACASDAENELQRRRRAAARTGISCQICGKPFTPPRSDGRYCTPACRQKAYRQRQSRAS